MRESERQFYLDALRATITSLDPKKGWAADLGIFRLKFLCFAVLLVCPLLSSRSVSGQTSTTRQLTREITQFYSNFAMGRYEAQWRMTSIRFKRANEWNEKSYIANLQTFKDGDFTFEILTARIVGKRANVRIKKCLCVQGSPRCEEVKEIWVFEQGYWRYDSQVDAVAAFM